MVRNYQRKTSDRWSKEVLQGLLDQLAQGQITIDEALRVKEYKPISRATLYRYKKKAFFGLDQEALKNKKQRMEKISEALTDRRTGPSPFRGINNRDRHTPESRKLLQRKRQQQQRDAGRGGSGGRKASTPKARPTAQKKRKQPAKTTATPTIKTETTEVKKSPRKPPRVRT